MAKMCLEHLPNYVEYDPEPDSDFLKGFVTQIRNAINLKGNKSDILEYYHHNFAAAYQACYKLCLYKRSSLITEILTNFLEQIQTDSDRKIKFFLVRDACMYYDRTVKNIQKLANFKF